MSLRHSYTLLAPIYDALVRKGTANMRRDSLAQLPDVTGKHILLAGVGTGLDFPYLPAQAHYTGIDITPAMLARARVNVPSHLQIELQEADLHHLPYANNSFDHVIMHLILAVVPDAVRALQEVQRIIRPGGRIFIVDKFIRRGQLALSRRFINLILRHIATRTDVIFEDVLETCPQLQLISDVPTMAGGWFRRIVLEKTAP